MSGFAGWKRSLVLEAPTETPDGAGGHAAGWTVLGTLWGRVSRERVALRSADGVPVTRMRAQITVRAAPDGAPSRPVAGQRLRDAARIYVIEAVHEHPTRRNLLVCHVNEELHA